MGINFEGMKPEMKTKFDQIFADGKVSQSEINSLTAEEQDELLQGLSGKVSQENLDSITKMVKDSQKKGNAAQGKDEAPSFWKHPVDWFTSDKVSTGKKVLAGVGIAAGAAAAVAGAIAYPAAAICVAGIGALASCAPGDDDPAIDITVNNEVKPNIKITVTVEQKIQEIDNGKNDEIVALLKSIVSLLERGINISTENNKMLTKILNALTTQNLNNEELKALLQKVLDTLNQAMSENRELSKEQTTVMNAILDAITKLDSDVSKNLLAIIDKIDNMGKNNYDLLVKILNEIKSGNTDNSEILNAILAQVTNHAKKDEEMDTKTHDLLVQILNNMGKMHADMSAALSKLIAKVDTMSKENRALLQAILNKLGDMDANQEKFFTQILVKFDQLNAGQQQNLKKILDAIGNNTAAINKNTQVAEATYDLLTKLLAKIDQLGGKADEILDAIANISTGTNVDLSTIEKLLADLLKSSEANNEVLTNIEDKLDAVSVTLGGIKVMLGEGHEKLLAKLDEILKKIPHGCNCDITLIIQKLDELIESLKNNPDDDGKHEGILDDLDKYFN